MILSIIIVNWNCKDILDNCVSSIIDKISGLSYEIIIIDNASTDGSQEMLIKKYSTCKLILNKDNIGFAKANNQALPFAEGEYILYLNPDTELISNSLKAMIEFLQVNQEYGAVGCKLISPDGRIQFDHAREFPTPFNQFYLLSMLSKIFPKIRFFNSSNMEYWDHNSSREIKCLSGACIMIRRKIANNLNGFDESYYMYGEDVDLCYRIRKMGWKIFYLSEETILHHSGISSDKRSNRNFTNILLRDTTYQFIKRHYGIFHAILYRLLVLVGSLIRIAVIIPLLLFKKVFCLNNIPINSHILIKYINTMLWSIYIIDKNKVILR